MSTSDWDGSGGGHIKVYSTGNTFVPDDNFEQALIDLGYDDTLDDYVVTDSISSVTSLVVYNEGISDLTGIEGFTALTYLNCYGNELTSLDVSSNTALTKLICGNNSLTSLDFSNNIDLIKTLDGVDNIGSTIGSNAFAFNSNKTADGKTYLNVNTHQPLEGPFSWYEAHINSNEGWNMLGGLFPGLPIPVIGTNNNLAWTHTYNSVSYTHLTLPTNREV